MSTYERLDVSLPDGRRLCVRRSPGRGRPVVLLHGLLDDSTGWTRVMERLGHPCVAVDLPGFGGSSLPTRPRIADFADDVAAGLAELGIVHATLVGHSLGGAVAVAVAERSAAVDSLALLAPAGFGPIGLADFAARPGVAALTQAAIPLGLMNPLVVTAAYSTLVAHRRLPPAELVSRVRRTALRGGRGPRMAIEAVAHAGHARAGFHARRVAFEGPVSVLWGARDALVPLGHADALVRALPQATVEVWQQMGHHPQRERPEALERFLRRAAWVACPRAGRRRPQPTGTRRGAGARRAA
ncbi:MAG TPA: alpha/beta fold hydrolase [Baekduia sp.]|nr:alpha/beta fold hydrolase [Baekduia sp.]